MTGIEYCTNTVQTESTAEVQSVKIKINMHKNYMFDDYYMYDAKKNSQLILV